MKAKALNIPVKIMSNAPLEYAFYAVQRADDEWETIAAGFGYVEGRKLYKHEKSMGQGIRPGL